MKFLRCYGAIYRMTETNYQTVLRRLANDESTCLAAFGDLWGEPIVGESIDIGTMTREQAQELICADISSSP